MHTYYIYIYIFIYIYIAHTAFGLYYPCCIIHVHYLSDYCQHAKQKNMFSQSVYGNTQWNGSCVHDLHVCFLRI